jgi:uncharacterized RDD family membrane protein YckC
MSALSPALNSRQAELELPEEINLQLEVANVGSRSLAILADIGLGGLILFVVYSLTFLAGRDLAEDWFVRTGTSTLQILLLLAVFGFQWIYFNLFEWIWNGQTPGKRLLHLRVIKVDGTPVSGMDVLLRNISRPLDTFGPMGLIGLLMIFLSARAQRLGDLMARTMVIHETPIDWSIFDQLDDPGTAQAAASAPAIRLAPAQWELLHRFLNRRAQLPAEVRARLAGSLCETLKPFAVGSDLERSALAPEEWLLELSRRT